ncbi:hypothetical protein K2P47_05105 [Patescibacteria group bacterium]|nr:hypothetical protein [Patescibacteria group bacterium]
MAINQKILGAFVVGFALVFGAYTLSNFNAPRVDTQNEPVYGLGAAAVSERNYIAVTDNDNNGIEDWREEFVNDTPIIIDTEVAGPVQYTPPTSITDTVGIQLFQNFLQAKGRGGVGPSTDQVVTDTAELLRATAVQDYIYNVNQIQVIASSDEAIRTYANTLGQIMINNNVKTEGELVIIERAMLTENPQELDKLDPLITMYKNLRDQTLATPVPAGFEKQHLDLINVYNAMYGALDGMKKAFADPVVALLRVQRYQDDTKGLRIALENMYRSLVPYVRLFSESDPAIVFLVFSPQN